MNQLLEDNKHSNIESNKGDVGCHLHAQCKEHHLDVDARSRRRILEISCNPSVCLPFFSRAKQQSYQTQNICCRGSGQRSLPNTTCSAGHLSDGVGCDVAPRSAKLDILITAVIVTSLASTALMLCQHIHPLLNFLCHKIDETF